MEVYSAISTAAYFLGGCFLAVAIFCWFQFKIKEIMGDLSGRTARKAIARMHKDYRQGQSAAMQHREQPLGQRIAGQHRDCKRSREQAALPETVPLVRLELIQDIVLVHTDEYV